MNGIKATLGALVLAASLTTAVRSEPALEPAHAPCTGLDLWDDLQAVIGACEALIRSGSLDGGDLAEALRHQGDAYFRSFRIDVAFENYKRALELRPDWARALYNFGNAAALLGYGDLAIFSQQRAAEADPTYSKPHTALGISLSSIGDPEGALKEYDRALELDPKDYVARYNRALAYDTLGRKLEALHDLDALLADDEAEVNRTWLLKRRMPDEDFVGDVLRSRAIILRDVGSFDDALATLQAALDRRPGYANAAIFRSQLIRSVAGYKSFYGEAISAIDRAQALHPDSPEVPGLSVEKADLLIAMGKEREARELLADLGRFEPTANATFFMGRSHAWERLKEFERAEVDMLTAMRMDRWHYEQTIRSMQEAGYLMSWPGLDPNTTMANAITACVHDNLC